MDHPGKVANTARGQLKRENDQQYSVLYTVTNSGIIIIMRIR